ncbi:hypothetical protein [Streptomyces muensis]|uniref:Uncharacterized protein n=1 Tax=Streptomyces muensis TaxID=1077944 RepID=A0A9X1Q5W6_STRM4|nr:hypothetical protein [Streptomyces muensis]MCF1599101.1 hypothetical protein [Streptomyces muensis]
MRFQVQGAGVRLDHDRGWLVLTWGPAGSTDAQLIMPPDRCVSIHGRSAGHGTNLSLAFRFRPSEESGTEVTAEVVVGPDGAERAWQFAQWFAHQYGVQDLSASWWDLEPSTAEREEADRNWLSAPVSPATRVLLRSVMARLTVADT